MKTRFFSIQTSAAWTILVALALMLMVLFFKYVFIHVDASRKSLFPSRSIDEEHTVRTERFKAIIKNRIQVPDWKIDPTDPNQLVQANYPKEEMYELVTELIKRNFIGRSLMVRSPVELFHQILDQFNPDGKLLDIMPGGIFDQNRENLWHNNTSVFGDTLDAFRNMMVLSLWPFNEYKTLAREKDRIWTYSIIFCRAIMAVLPTKPAPWSFPFGKNWYQFSISLPVFLACITYLAPMAGVKLPDDIRHYLGTYTNNYFAEPHPNERDVGFYSIGWKRDRGNAVMIGQGVRAIRIASGQFDPNAPSEVYIRKELTIPHPGLTKGEGVYPDGSVLAHTGLRGYGYYANQHSFYDYIYTMMLYGKPVDPFLNIFRFMQHPQIPYVFGALFTRNGSITAPHNYIGTLGVHVMSHVRLINAKRPAWMVQFFCQHKQLFYYEADNTHNRFGQHWVMNRTILHRALPFGAVFELLVPHLTGVFSYGGRVGHLPSVTQTTYGYRPEEATSIIVGTYDDGAVACLNYYRLVIDTGSNSFITVAELMLITMRGYHVHYTIWPDHGQLKHDQLLRLSLALGVETYSGRCSNRRHRIMASNQAMSPDGPRGDDEMAVQLIQCGNIATALHLSSTTQGSLLKSTVKNQATSIPNHREKDTLPSELTSWQYQFTELIEPASSEGLDENDDGVSFATLGASQLYTTVPEHCGSFSNELISVPTGGCIETERYRLWVTFDPAMLADNDDWRWDSEKKYEPPPATVVSTNVDLGLDNETTGMAHDVRKTSDSRLFGTAKTALGAGDSNNSGDDISAKDGPMYDQWKRATDVMRTSGHRELLYKSAHLFLQDRHTKKCHIGVDMGDHYTRNISIKRDRITSQLARFETDKNTHDNGTYIMGTCFNNNLTPNSTPYQLTLNECLLTPGVRNTARNSKDT